jgi:hypothetical protein
MQREDIQTQKTQGLACSLDVLSRLAQCPYTSAADIIRQIGALPLEEQPNVIALSKELDKNRELTHEEFLALAKKYQDTTDSGEVTGLEDELVRRSMGPARSLLD